VGVKAPRQAGHRRAHDGGEHEVVRDVHADRLGERLVLPEGHEGAADARPDETSADQVREQHRREHEVVVGPLAAEGPGAEGRRGHAGEPERAVGQLHPVDAHQRDDAREADGDEDEVGAAELEGEAPDQPAGQRGQCDRAGERQPERPLEPERQERRGVGADAEEGGVAERELPGVAEEEVQRERQHAEDPRHDDDVEKVGALEPERQREGEEDRCSGRREPGVRRRWPAGGARGSAAHPILSDLAKRPAGRSSSTTMMITNPTASR